MRTRSTSGRSASSSRTSPRAPLDGEPVAVDVDLQRADARASRRRPRGRRPPPAAPSAGGPAPAGRGRAPGRRTRRAGCGRRTAPVGGGRPAVVAARRGCSTAGSARSRRCARSAPGSAAVRTWKRTVSPARSWPSFQRSSAATVSGQTNPPRLGPSGPRITGMSPVRSTAPTRVGRVVDVRRVQAGLAAVGAGPVGLRARRGARRCGPSCSGPSTWRRRTPPAPAGVRNSGSAWGPSSTPTSQSASAPAARLRRHGAPAPARRRRPRRGAARRRAAGPGRAWPPNPPSVNVARLPRCSGTSTPPASST